MKCTEKGDEALFVPHSEEKFYYLRFHQFIRQHVNSTTYQPSLSESAQHGGSGCPDSPLEGI